MCTRLRSTSLDDANYIFKSCKFYIVHYEFPVEKFGILIILGSRRRESKSETPWIPFTKSSSTEDKEDFP